MTYIRVCHVENHVEIFWTFAEIVHNDQPHPFGKNYIRMMRKTLRIFCRLRFLIKSFIEKLSSKKYFFSSKFRCSSVRWVFQILFVRLSIFPFFQSRSTCQCDRLVMAPFAAKKRGRNASSGSYQTPEAKRSKKSRRESKGRSVMPATVSLK